MSTTKFGIMSTKYGSTSTKYVIDRWSTKITAYECTKESSKMATVIDRYGEPMTKRKGIYVFDTWAEAHAALTRRAELELNQSRRALERAQGLADDVRGMKPPEEAMP